MDDATKKLLEELARKLGTTAHELGVHTAAHTGAAGWVGFAICVIIILSTVALTIWAIKSIHKISKYTNDYTRQEGDAEGPLKMITIIVSMIIVIITLEVLHGHLSAALEPVGATVKQLLK